MTFIPYSVILLDYGNIIGIGYVRYFSITISFKKVWQKEITIPLMRRLFSLDCAEQNIIETVESLEYINPEKLTDLRIDSIESNRESAHEL